MDSPKTLMSASTYSSNSKDGSAKSEASSKDPDKDFNISATSPIDLECHIQCERITKILDEAIYKCKLSICLPDMVAEFKTLTNVLSSTHMDDLLFIFDQYDNPQFSASALNISAMTDLKAGDLSLKTRLNADLSHVLHIMNSYPQLKLMVDIIYEQKRRVYKESKTTNASFSFLAELEQFRDLVIRKMETTAAEELGTKISTKKLVALNEDLVVNIKEHTATLQEDTAEFEQAMATKIDLITRLEQELAQLNYDAMIKLKKKVLDSERQMAVATRAHLVKDQLLREEEREFKKSYDHLRRGHLAMEKNQQDHRIKVESQLMTCLQKYDAEMSAKQKELDDYTAKHEDEVRQCEELQRKLDVQDIDYIPLMAEREEEYHQEMTAKMEKFLREHAARVIQAAWREVLASRAEKKRQKGKAKKGKKK